jgi:hypothetical protein
MEYAQAIRVWMTIDKIVASFREPGELEEGTICQPEVDFVPFHLPPLNPQLTAETQPAVAGTKSEAMPVAV